MNRLHAKTALVIGASAGIGREVCRLFAQEGADVAIADLGHGADKATLIDEHTPLGRRAFAIEVDVLVEEQVRAAIDKTLHAFGHLDTSSTTLASVVPVGFSLKNRPRTGSG